MDPFVAEIRILPFNQFAPKGWAFCDGQLLALSQNTALFSLLGTTYGGVGKTNFRLPDMQGRAPMHPGQGLGLSPHVLGEASGTDKVTLLESEMPVHPHTVESVPGNFAGNTNVPTNTAFAKVSQGNPYVAAANPVAMSFQTIATAGSSLPHNNRMPYLTLSFCIALQGVFPPRG